MAIGAAIGSAVIGAAGSAISANKQSNAIKDSSRDSIAMQQQQFNQMLEITQPQRDAQNAATSYLMQLLGIPVSAGGTSGASSAYGSGPFNQPGANFIFNGLGGYDGVGLGGFDGLGGGAKGWRNERRQRIPGTNQAGPGVPGLGGGAYPNIPGQDFAINEAMRAIERSAAAGGGSLSSLHSGNTLAALQDRAQGIASQNFLSHLINPLLQMSGSGAAQAAGNNAMNLGVNVGNTMTTAGQNRADVFGTAGSGITSSLQDGIGSFGTWWEGR
jgi:hypothetical protein